jgi:nucleoside-diphosphate-sugar epimerase
MPGAERILVTGARGFIGSQVVAIACDRGLNTVAAYRGASHPGTVHLNVCDPASVDAAFHEVAPSLVVHCAAYGVNYADQDPDLALSVNVHGSLHVLDAAARYRVRRVVHLGSCFEYGSYAVPISEDMALNPTALYGATKAAASLLMLERARTLGVSLIVARPFGTWGPGEAAFRLVPQVLQSCVERTPLKLTACEVVRDYTYVEDIAARILALLMVDAVPAGTVVNVGSGQSWMLRDFVLAIARMFDAEALMQFGALEYRSTEMSSLVAEVTRLRGLIGELRSTTLDVGVRRTLARLRAGSPARC